MMTQLRQRMLEELERSNYASGTIRLYIQPVAAFAQHFHRSPDQPGAEEIRQYQLFLIDKKKLAWYSYNQIVCALRFFYAYNPQSRGGSQILAAPQHLKSRALLMTTYAASLR